MAFGVYLNRVTHGPPTTVKWPLTSIILSEASLKLFGETAYLIVGISYPHLIPAFSTYGFGSSHVRFTDLQPGHVDHMFRSTTTY